MLQQTQVDRVIPKYLQFLSRFPTLHSLAQARFADVLGVWVGLGYNGRALRLWQCARDVVAHYAGKLPRDSDKLRQLPGIGPYTAAAIASFAFGAHVPVIDTNVSRVLTRALLGRDAGGEPNVGAASYVPPKSVASSSEWAQALMDVGALFCKARPRCELCPARRSCEYALNGRPNTRRRRTRGPAQRYAGSTRFYRGRIMRALSKGASLSVTTLARQVREGFGVSDAAWFDDILAGLARDGLIRVDRAAGRVRLP